MVVDQEPQQVEAIQGHLMQEIPTSLKTLRLQVKGVKQEIKMHRCKAQTNIKSRHLQQCKESMLEELTQQL
jgi:hypothetical protein